MHTLTAVSLFAAVASALLLYGLSYDTRLVETAVIASERQAERLRSDITVLRAERAHLSRPERIAPIALKLGLRPTQPGQILPAGPNTLAAAGPSTQP